MSDWEWVTYSDRSAVGWGLVESESSGAQRHDQLLERLAQRFPQLDSSLSPTVGVPIWTLVFNDSTTAWLLAVRGRGGEFGNVGMTQYLLAPPGVPGREVWSRARAAMTSSTGLDTARLADAPPRDATLAGQVDPAVLVDAVMGAVSLARVTLCDTTPTLMLDVVQAALDILPDPLVRTVRWSTVELNTQPQKDTSSVSARWPAAFVAVKGDDFGRLDHVAREATTPTSEKRTKAADETVRWLASQDTTMRSRFARDDVTDLGAWLKMVKAGRPPSTSQLARLLSSPTTDEQDLAARWPGEVDTFVASHLDQAPTLLVHVTDTSLWERIFLLVLTATERDGRDYFKLGTTYAPQSKVELVVKLRSRLDLQERMDLVTSLERPGLPFADWHRSRELDEVLEGLEVLETLRPPQPEPVPETAPVPATPAPAPHEIATRPSGRRDREIVADLLSLNHQDRAVDEILGQSRPLQRLRDLMRAPQVTARHTQLLGRAFAMIAHGSIGSIQAEQVFLTLHELRAEHASDPTHLTAEWFHGVLRGLERYETRNPQGSVVTACNASQLVALQACSEYLTKRVPGIGTEHLVVLATQMAGFEHLVKDQRPPSRTSHASDDTGGLGPTPRVPTPPSSRQKKWYTPWRWFAGTSDTPDTEPEPQEQRVTNDGHVQNLPFALIALASVTLVAAIALAASR